MTDQLFWSLLTLVAYVLSLMLYRVRPEQSENAAPVRS